MAIQHAQPGDAIDVCPLADRFTSMGEPKKLRAGDMLYLAAEKPHAVEAVEDTSFQLTFVAQSSEVTR